ncbi:MAG: ABC-F family ATP-binding cassette domain-containing protein, partial [Pseudomonadota bacterium]
VVIALVGPNGAGKTTLMSILIGDEPPSAGEVTTKKNLRIGFLPQRPELRGNHTLHDEAIAAFDDLRARERVLNDLEQQMADGDMSAVERYGRLQEAFEADGGYTYASDIRMVLAGLGFGEDEWDTPLNQLSGGQKTRAVLARLLLEKPDLLALDEPTNHLDIAAVEWLESYLKDFPGAVLAISHDRYFIDAFATNVWEMNFGRLETYRGDYTHYLRQREERRERLQAEFEKQREFIAKEEEYIRRNIAGQNTRQAQGRRKRLERLKRDELIHAPDADRDTMKLRLEIAHRGNEIILATDDLAVGYNGQPILDVDEIRLVRGEIAALIGPNGVGKSTIIKTVLGQQEPVAGTVTVGDKVEVGYFAQAHETLKDSNTIIDEIYETKRMDDGAVRDYLARFLFRGDDVFRRISSLSGGERGRVALAKLALGTANLLLLDEPTNHLDIPSQEVLEDMLSDYPGTVLLISHDRYLIDALATQIWAASPGEPGNVRVFRGTYSEYVAARNAERAAAGSPDRADRKNRDNRDEKPGTGNNPGSRPNQNGKNGVGGASQDKPAHGLNPYQLKKRIAELEASIEQMEARMDELTTGIEAASAEGNAALVQSLGDEYAQTEIDLEAAVDEWGTLAE